MGTNTYSAWYGAKDRCRSNRSHLRKWYAGIDFCDKWNDFMAFLEDMGEAPSESHCIDRIDPTKGYSPDNCRWVTPQQSAANTRSTNKTGFKGVSKLPSGRYRAQVRAAGIRHHVGVFETAREAAIAYDKEAIRQFGEYAMTNARMGNFDDEAS